MTWEFSQFGIGGITLDEYDKKAQELKQKQFDLDIKQKQHTEADESFSITINYLLNLYLKAYELFESSKVEQKRQVINFVLSNLKLRGQKLIFELIKPFDAIYRSQYSFRSAPLN